MAYQELPVIYSYRRGYVVSYIDYSQLEKCLQSPEKGVRNSTILFSSAAKKRMKRILDLWHYSLSSENNMAFITLTLSSTWHRDTNYITLLQYFIEKMTYRYGGFNYVYKAEHQKNGNIHFHILTDCLMDWRVIRGVWNKLQRKHVDEYQIKMKKKYKNGFYFDKNMVNNNNVVVSEDIQFKRYKSGVKANWRNPNSTDIDIVDNIEQLGAYLNKYMTKSEEEINEKTPLKRYWGKNQELELLRYCTINENQIPLQKLIELEHKTIKEVVNNNKIVCKIHEVVTNTDINNLVDVQIKKNQEILGIRKNKIKQSNILIEKEIKKYKILFENN